MIGKTITHYTIRERLGEGGMGVVYKAEDLKLGRPVALKVLSEGLTRDDDAKQRFLNEARAASRLDHPNICTIHEAGETDDGRMFLAMSYYEGETLAERLKRGPVAIGQAVEIVGQIARGLSSAHAAGIIHRDIKPANVIVTRDGIAKILDFGIAKLSGQPVTRTGTLVGTLAYMAPEQLRGERPSPATDLWALGVVFYQLLSGRRPFDAESEPTVILSIINDPVTPIATLVPDVPKEVAAIVDRLLAKEPSERYESADQLIDDLRALPFASDPVTTVRPISGRTPAPPATPLLRRALRPSIIVGIAILAVLAAMLVRGRHPGASSTRPTPASPAGATRAMIAVLPFQNLGAPEDAFFADGITEEIIGRLAAVEEIGVISRTSVYAYDRKGRTAREIGKDLGVSYILDGTVQWEKSGGRNRVRVTPQLVRVADDTHIWSDRYDREIADVFAVQDDIAEQVIRQLGVRLASSGAGAGRHLTSNVDAYELYLRASKARWTYSGPELRAGIALAEQAIALDPRFAAAYALAGHLQVRLFHHGFDRSEPRLELARANIEKALAIDPASPEARIALGYYEYWAERDYEKAIDEFNAARRIRPGDTTLLAGVAYAHRRQGNFETALPELLEVQHLDPRNALIVGEVAMTYQGLRRFDDAERVLRRGIEDFPSATFLYTLRSTNRLLSTGSVRDAAALLDACPQSDEETLVSARISLAMCERNADGALEQLAATNVPTFVTATTFGMWGAAHYPKALLVAWARQLQGNVAEARKSFESARKTLEAAKRESPGDDRVHSALGLAYAGLGRFDDAIREGRKGAQLCTPEADAIDSSMRLLELARIHAEAGDANDAIDAIERVLSSPAIFTAKLLRVDPAWDPLRSNPRFQHLLDDGGRASTPTGGR